MIIIDTAGRAELWSRSDPHSPICCRSVRGGHYWRQRPGMAASSMLKKRHRTLASKGRLSRLGCGRSPQGDRRA
jgi:hypothetical protein